MAPRLELKGLSKRFAERVAVDDVSLALAPGQVTCLLGPSGCGKSTTLRIAAGIERQDRGEIRLDGDLICDGTTSLPPEKRGVGLMFQDFALFPHLSVARNIAYGLRSPKAEQATRVAGLLSRVGLSGFERAMPHELSGGEQQRVALARALAPRPRVMLMDEPFSGLDERLRDSVRDEALNLLRAEGTSVLLVTHDPEEAMRVADEIALMRDGRIVQQGSPYVVYTRPVDLAAARFFSDLNTLTGTVQGALVDTPFGPFLVPGQPDGTEVEVAIRPQHVRVDFDRPGNAPRVTETDGQPAHAAVIRARFVGHQSLVDFRLDAGPMLTASLPGVFLPKPGTTFFLTVPRKHCKVFPR
ncbi:MAG: ABC transporter ATP-binding protein [Shimia sp.]